MKKDQEFPFTDSSVYITGTGQPISGVHKANENCEKYGCVMHNPTDHNMITFPLNWNQDKRIMERVCPHGVAHPDPDAIAYRERIFEKAYVDAAKSHANCDGCCTVKEP